MSSANASTVAEQFTRARSQFADHRCLLTQEGWWTYEQAARAAESAAALLFDTGARFGDRVIVALPNSAILRVLEQGTMTFGLVRVALSPRLHPREIAAIAVDCEAAVVCCTADAAEPLRQSLSRCGSTAAVIVCSDANAQVTPGELLRSGRAAPVVREISPSDLAMLMYSSGTTGEPKASPITHRAWVEQTSRALAQLPPIGPRDVVLAAAPMSHFGGSIGLDCAVSGAAAVPLDRFEPASVVAAIARHEVTILPLAPILLTRLADALPSTPGADTGSLRAVPYGGSPIHVDALVDAARKLPGLLVQFYGLAEALAPLSCLSAQAHDRAASAYTHGTAEERQRAASTLSSAGIWVPGVEHRIVDGELHVRGGTVTAGYWRRDLLNSRRFSDGWFATGDIVEMDGTAMVHVLGRTDDAIITGGFNVSPGEIERVLAEVAAVREVAVLGLPHRTWGQGITAFVVLDHRSEAASRAEPDRAELLLLLQEAARSRLASYKKPIAVHILDELPRNAAGKLDRARLRAIALDHQESLGSQHNPAPQESDTHASA